MGIRSELTACLSTQHPNFLTSHGSIGVRQVNNLLMTPCRRGVRLKSHVLLWFGEEHPEPYVNLTLPKRYLHASLA